MGMLICRRMANGRSWDILAIHPFGGNRDDLLFQQVPKEALTKPSLFWRRRAAPGWLV